MRRFLSALVFASVSWCTAVALAQPAGRPARVMHPSKAPRPNGPRDNGTDARTCTPRRSMLTTEEKRIEAVKADIGAAETEMAQLQSRLDELKRQRDDARRSLPALEARVRDMRNAYNKDCQANESCDMYEQQAATLDRQGDGIEAELAAMRNDIAQNQSATSGLEQRIKPLQNEYGEKNCNNLVPGETAQPVIDRCAALFSEWNRLQADLNRQNTRIPALKGRYQQLFAELQNIEARANGYEQYLTKNCTASAETAKMRAYPQKRQRAQSVGAELDRFVSDLTRLRGIKITIAPK